VKCVYVVNFGIVESLSIAIGHKLLGKKFNEQLEYAACVVMVYLCWLKEPGDNPYKTCHITDMCIRVVSVWHRTMKTSY